MNLVPGTAVGSITIDAAFIGSCTNSRIEDLRAAADVLRGRRVAPGVTAVVAPGSMSVKAQAEAEGLADIFAAAGFAWGGGAARCASPPTGTSCRRVRGARRPPTGTSRDVRGRARART